jgi:hypothetical protein
MAEDVKEPVGTHRSPESVPWAARFGASREGCDVGGSIPPYSTAQQNRGTHEKVVPAGHDVHGDGRETRLRRSIDTRIHRHRGP